MTKFGIKMSTPYRNSLLVGILLGGILFLSPILSGKFGVIGADYFFRRFPSTGENVALLVIPYIVGSTILFVLFTLTPWFRRHKSNIRLYILSYLVFLGGIFIAFIIFLVLGIWAISRGGFLFFY